MSSVPQVFFYYMIVRDCATRLTSRDRAGKSLRLGGAAGSRTVIYAAVTTPEHSQYVSRGGEKLEAALTVFGIDVCGLVCADLGSHVGGFVDCLLQRGATRVYSVDTSYGTLAWRLRKDDRVVVFERTNAMHAALPQPVDLVTVDVGWTPQSKVLPNVRKMLAATGSVVTLIKPHYEASASKLQNGILPEGDVEEVVAAVLASVRSRGWEVVQTVQSPIKGHGGNRELFARLRPV